MAHQLGLRRHRCVVRARAWSRRSVNWNAPSTSSPSSSPNRAGSATTSAAGVPGHRAGEVRLCPSVRTSNAAGAQKASGPTTPAA